MEILFALALCAAGLVLVIFCAERLVKGAVGTSVGFGVSTFLISVIFIGFDPENLAVGAAGAFEGVAGFALGSVIGAAMVAIALAFGITALITPMRFGQAPSRVLLVPILAILLLGALGLDGTLSRTDGLVLLGGFTLAVAYLARLSKQGLDVRPTGELAETLRETPGRSRWKSLGLLLLSLAGLVVGSELLVFGAKALVAQLALSETVFGMTILALAVSVEELARELPAALKGRPEIAFGNVAGSILAFFLFNAGVIAMVRPVSVGQEVVRFYLPVCLLTMVVVAAFMSTRRVSRAAGAVLIALYLLFLGGAFVWR